MSKNSPVNMKIRFKTSEEGGRKSSVHGEYYSCPIIIDGEAFDCRMMLNGRSFQLGEWYEVAAVFLNPHLVLPKLQVGKDVILWEGKEIGVGKILKSD